MLQRTEESEHNIVNLRTAEEELTEEKHNLGSDTGLYIKTPVLSLFLLAAADTTKKIKGR